MTVAYNPSYTFVSRTDIQHWATGDVSIPVRTVLGTATVPSIAANKKVSVKIDAAADSDALKALQMWAETAAGHLSGDPGDRLSIHGLL